MRSLLLPPRIHWPSSSSWISSFCRLPPPSRSRHQARRRADQAIGRNAALVHGGVEGASDSRGVGESLRHRVGGGAIQRIDIEGRVFHDLAPLHAGQRLCPPPEGFGPSLAVDLAFHGPGKGPALGEFASLGEELEGDQGQRLVAGRLLRVQIPAHHGGGDLALADGEEALDIRFLLAGIGDAVEEHVVDALMIELSALQQGAERLHQQRLAGAEETADPDADTALVLAIRGIAVGVQRPVQEPLPLRGDHETAQLCQHHCRFPVEDLDDRFDGLGDGSGEEIAYLHYSSSPR